MSPNKLFGVTDGTKHDKKEGKVDKKGVRAMHKKHKDKHWGEKERRKLGRGSHQKQRSDEGE